jgi:CheY-like chemotaxis protein
MALASSKTVEIAAPKRSLTPCILDEDPAQLEVLSAVITEMGYEPIPTSDPAEALQLVKRGRCRLVLVDMHMPGMDGYEFLDQLSRSDPGVHVIVMTGNTHWNPRWRRFEGERQIFCRSRLTRCG